MGIDDRALVPRWMSWGALALGLWLGMEQPVHAQSCPTIPSTVQVVMSGSIHYPEGETENINSTLTHTQNANQCDDNPTGLSAVVCSYLTPFTAVLAAKILQIVDRTPQGFGLFDAACGNLSGTLTIGGPGLVLANGTVALQFAPPSTVNAVINMTTDLSPSFFTGVPGRSTLAEQVSFPLVGQAKGAGSFRLELDGEVITVPFSTTYQLVGAPNARPNRYLTVDTDLTYNCSSSQVTSRLCLAGSIAPVPLPRSAVFWIGPGLLALGGFALIRTRRRRRLTTPTQPPV